MNTAVPSIMLAGAWLDAFTNMPQERLFVWVLGLVVVLASLLKIVAIVSRAIVTSQRQRMEIELKREMIDRGLSAEEIQEVLEAKLPATDETTSYWSAKSK